MNTPILIRSRSERPPTRQGTVGPRKRNGRWFSVLSLLNLLGLIVVWAILHVVSERWWIGTVATYGPRLPFAAPATVLLIASFRRRRAAVGMNVAALLLALGPIAELRLPNPPWEASSGTSAGKIKIVSCNVQAFRPDFAAVLQEISTHHPDIVVFQEALAPPPVLDAYFADWHTVHRDKFWIASRYPMRVAGLCGVAAFGRVTALKVEVEGPAGRFFLTDMHLMTPRHGLVGLNWRSLRDGSGPEQIERESRLRSEEARITRAFAEENDPKVPWLVAGDFNTPTSSHLFRTHWGDLTSAFDAAGSGYGYTAPCRPHRYWFDRVPWVRIDHILVSSHWCVETCEIGRGNGSDHRLIATTLSLR